MAIFSRCLQWINRFVEAISILLLCIMVILVFLQILSRTLFASSFSWTEEVARFGLVWLVFLAGGIAFQYGEHIGIDMLFSRLSERNKKYAQVVLALFCGMFLVVLTYTGYQLCVKSMAQTSPALGISMGYIYAVIPIGGVLMILNLIDVTWKYFVTPKPSREEGGES